jgi:hypothetical protein
MRRIRVTISGGCTLKALTQRGHGPLKTSPKNKDLMLLWWVDGGNRLRFNLTCFMRMMR